MVFDDENNGDFMSVLIKGMQMPDRCIDCPFMISRDNDDCILQSDAANELFMNWDDMKLNCPLVELPEHHGRLIDADELKTAFPRCDNNMDIKIASARATINHMPTIVEAE